MSTSSTSPENASSLAARSRKLTLFDNNNASSPDSSISEGRRGGAHHNKLDTVDSRSNPLATSISTTTTHLDNDILSTAFPPSIDSVASPTIESSNRPSPSKTSTRKEQNHPQLSERDSIFATSYITNDSTASTPRAPHIKDDQSEDVDSNVRLPPAIVSGGKTSDRSSLKLSFDSPSRKRANTVVQKVDGDIYQTKDEPLKFAKGDQQSTIQKSKSPRLPPRSQTSYQLQMSSKQWQPSDAPQKKLEFADSSLAGGSNVEESKSRSRQEERIEAILTDDPAPHGRSRKASHYLGIFKEKGSVQDGAKNTKTKSTELDLNIKLDQLDGLKLSDASEAVSSPVPLEQTPTQQTGAVSDDTDKPFAPTLVQESSSQATSPLTSLFSHRSSLTETEDENISNLGDSIEWRSADTGHTGLPIRLLEDIRNSGGKGKLRSSTSTSKKVKPVVTDDKQSTHDQNRGEESASPKADVDDDEEYSDKEHITSATYYPHQAPSPETAAEAKLLTEEEVRQTDTDLGPPAQIIGSEGDFSPVLQESNDKAQYFEQELLKDRQKSVKPSARTRWSIVSVSSDTEYESGYETAQSDKGYESTITDGGDQTPTATPRVSSGFPKGRSKKPLKAVELKPYQHQVGGHTKVFSFSKQAICKQLNNRENVFYEVIERRHPELLTFMPKYLGVLNVTYNKGQSKRKSDKTKTKDKDSVPVNNAQSTEKSEQPKDLSTRSSSHTRVISHSSGFDKLEDAVPRVVYANNMHIIPDNLFRSRLLAQDNARPATSDGLPGSVIYKTKSASEETSGSCKRIRPSLAKSMSAWGATMINTQFKEKVLREVFSPPQIHHRPRGRRRRSRNDFRSLRGQTENYSDFAETSDVAVFSPTESLPGMEKSTQKQSLLLSVNTSSTKESIKIGSAPHSGEKSFSRLTSADSQDDTDTKLKPQRAKSIRRRRSGGGLRRKQNEIVDGQRGEFEYYEEADIDPDKDDIFPMELLSQTSPQLTTLDGARDFKSQDVAKSSDASTAEATPVSQPNNPLEAQQSSDERVEHFLLLEDLTAGMSRPCVLDLKMGTRQYGVDATKKKQQSQRQKCKSTTSQQLGVRLCGMQVWNAQESKYVFEDKYAGRDIHAGREFQDALLRFLSGGVSNTNTLRHIPSLLEKLSKLENIIVSLPGYRFYASSLLVLYDGDDKQDDDVDPKSVSSSRSASKDRRTGSSIDIRLVDFANCVTGEDKLRDDTLCPPKDRDGVDKGYIRGLKSLRRYLRRISKELSEEQWTERGEIDKHEEGEWRDEWAIDDGEVSV